MHVGWLGRDVVSQVLGNVAGGHVCSNATEKGNFEQYLDVFSLDFPDKLSFSVSICLNQTRRACFMEQFCACVKEKSLA